MTFRIAATPAWGSNESYTMVGTLGDEWTPINFPFAG